MSLVLKRIVWPDGSSRPDDFNILHDDKQVVGRIYRMSSVGREQWRWTTIDWCMGGPNGGVADSIEQAKAAFRNAWDSYQLNIERMRRRPKASRGIE
jgi:hypothetical protein